jgi:hypothetical protein
MFAQTCNLASCRFAARTVSRRFAAGTGSQVHLLTSLTGQNPAVQDHPSPRIWPRSSAAKWLNASALRNPRASRMSITQIVSRANV